MNYAMLALAGANPGLLPLAISGRASRRVGLYSAKKYRGDEARNYIAMTEAMVENSRVSALCDYFLYNPSASTQRAASVVLRSKMALSALFVNLMEHGVYPLDDHDNNRQAWLKAKTKALIKHDRTLNGGLK